MHQSCFYNNTTEDSQWKPGPNLWEVSWSLSIVLQVSCLGTNSSRNLWGLGLSTLLLSQFIRSQVFCSISPCADFCHIIPVRQKIVENWFFFKEVAHLLQFIPMWGSSYSCQPAYLLGDTVLGEKIYAGIHDHWSLTRSISTQYTEASKHDMLGLMNWTHRLSG